MGFDLGKMLFGSKGGYSGKAQSLALGQINDIDAMKNQFSVGAMVGNTMTAVNRNLTSRAAAEGINVKSRGIKSNAVSNAYRMASTAGEMTYQAQSAYRNFLQSLYGLKGQAISQYAQMTYQPPTTGLVQTGMELAGSLAAGGYFNKK